MPLAPLPPSTVKLIGSSQVITSVSSVIKELMENSIDSGAQHIEIKLDKHGLEKIEVKDDGCGIGKNDVTVMCLPNYTSKILNFSDLDSLSSYGFRGEALSSLCNVAQVTVTTKTAEDDVANCYTYDHNGQVICSKISHISKGTIVTVTELFKKLPVRKQFVSSSKKAAEELKQVEKVVKSLAMIHPRLRVTLIHNKFLIWQKTSVASLRQSVMQVVNLTIVKQLHHILHSFDKIRAEMLVPKRDCDVSSMCFSNFSDACFLFINNRPLRGKEIEKAVYNKLFEYFGVYVPSSKYPVCVISLTLPADCLDVNLEPNKTRVYLKNQEEVLDFVSQCLHLYYGDGKKEEVEELPQTKHVKKRKTDEEYLVDPKKLHVNELNTNVANDDLHIPVKEGKCTDEASPSKSCSEAVTCSDKLTSEQESEITQDVDCTFEEFCLSREKELINYPQDIQDNPANKDLKTDSETNLTKKCSNFFPISNKERNSGKEPSDNDIQDNLLNKDLKTVSETSLTRKCSTFFPISNKERNNEPSHNDHSLISSINQQNINQQINLEQEFLECSNISSKKIIGSLKKTIASSYIFPPNQSSNSLPKTKELFPAKSEVFAHQESCMKHRETNDEDVTTNNITQGESCTPTLSQWSKGMVINSVGAQIKGPGLLAREPSPGSPIISQETDRSVSSQMGCKEMSAFTKFARKMRKEILEEKPDLSFTKVAQMLQVQWRHLDVEDKKKYEDTLKVNKSPITMKSPKQKPITAYMSSNPNVELDTSVEGIKKMMVQDECKSQSRSEENVRLVGQLEASSLWLYSDCRGVFSLAVPRLQEAVRYHQRLAEYALPPRLLEESVTITPRDLSAKEWELLVKLERSPNGVIKDQRFTSNGFVLEIGEDESEAHLSYVPQNIAYCGTDEVQEILQTMLDHGLSAPLAQCRPLNIVSFIRSEVMRECSREDSLTQPHQVSELLSYWLRNVAPQSQDCIHHRPVTQCLHSS